MLTYVFFMSYKLGEAYYFGYPFDLVWIDTNTIIHIIFQSVLLFLLYGFVARSGYRESLLYIIFFAIFMIIGVYFIDHKELYSFSSSILTIACCVLLFKQAEKYLETEDIKSLKIGTHIFALLTFTSFPFLFGNHTVSTKQYMSVDKDSLIIAPYNDQFIVLKCIMGKKLFSLQDISGKDIHLVDQSTLLRRTLTSSICTK